MIFFNKKIKELEEQLCWYENENEKLAKKLNITQLVYDEFDYLKIILKTASLLGVEIVNNELFFVTLRTGENPEIRLENKARQTNYPRLYFNVSLLDTFGFQEVKIIDILSTLPERNGIGSILLGYLDKYAAKNKIVTIKGELSCVDYENFNSLENFYKKNGYSVQFSDNRTSGSIRKSF